MKCLRTYLLTLFVFFLFSGHMTAVEDDYRVFFSVAGSVFHDPSENKNGLPNEGIWVTDGTPEGTVRLAESSSSIFGYSAVKPQIKAIGDTVFFEVYDELDGYSLNRTDGSKAGTRRITRKIEPGSPGVYGDGVVLVDDALFYKSYDPLAFWMVKVKGGAQPIKVLDIDYGFRWASPVKFKGAYYFIADTCQVVPQVIPRSGIEQKIALYRTDGISKAEMVFQFPFNEGAVDYPYTAPRVFNGKLLFFILNESDKRADLYLSDGSKQGTEMVESIHFRVRDGALDWREFSSDNLLYFAYDDGYYPPYNKLWRTDGSKEGTFFLKETEPDIFLDSSFIEKDIFYFSIHDGSPGSVNGDELWRSDGSHEGTYLLKKFTLGKTDYGFEPLGNIGKTTIFTVDSEEYGMELWGIDRTTEGTFMLMDINEGEKSSFPEFIFKDKNLIFFVAENEKFGEELWRTDGTKEGTYMVKDIFPGPGDGVTDYARPTIMGGNLYLVADDGVHGKELWRSDGTEKGTFMLKDMNPGPGSSQDYYHADVLTKTEENLYFGCIVTTSENQDQWGICTSNGTEKGTFFLKGMETLVLKNFMTDVDAIEAIKID